MGILIDQAKGCSGRPLTRRRRRLWVVPLVVVCFSLAGARYCWSLQRYSLTEGESADGGHAAVAAPATPQSPAAAHAPAETHSAPSVLPSQPSAQGAHGAPAAHGEPSKSAEHAAPVQTPSGGHGQTPTAAHEPATAGGHEAAPAHGAEGGGHGPALPEISPIPGVTFVETMIKLMDHELHGRFLGWRPNDIIIGQFTDDVNNYQLGVLEALRFTTLRLKDSLTRMGDADTYDPDLEQALNLLMNSATKFWFPSAESSYGEALDHLRAFVEKLKTGKRNFYYRRDNLVLLLSSYKDLLGNVNKTLVASPMSWFKTDDAFYYAKGVAHVYYEILKVVRVGYKNQLSTTMYGLDMMDTIIHEFYRVEQIDPWIILDGDLGGFWANHRANLNAPLSEAMHLLGVLSQL